MADRTLPDAGEVPANACPKMVAAIEGVDSLTRRSPVNFAKNQLILISGMTRSEISVDLQSGDRSERGARTGRRDGRDMSDDAKRIGIIGRASFPPNVCRL